MSGDGAPSTEVISSATLITRLEQLVEDAAHSRPMVVFDGDGTLWSGDVGNDVFDYATRRSLLRDALRPKLLREAVEYGLDIDTSMSTNALAAAFVRATMDGSYPEAPLCALQSWCYVGMTQDDVRELARTALGHEFPSRHQREVLDVIEWARARGVRTVVVSASPRLVVEAASEGLGFEPSDIVGVRTRVDAQGVVACDLEEEVPYGAGKVSQAQQYFGAGTWLAAFGDNSFDSHMLEAASIGVAVRPKPALTDLLHLLPNTLRLEPK